VFEITADLAILKEEVKASFDHRGLLPEYLGVGAGWAVAAISLVWQPYSLVSDPGKPVE
jgi:hypothetical protein